MEGVADMSTNGGPTGGMRVCGCSHIFFEHGPQGCIRCHCVDVRGGLLPGTASAEAMLALLSRSTGGGRGHAHTGNFCLTTLQLRPIENISTLMPNPSSRVGSSSKNWRMPSLKKCRC